MQSERTIIALLCRVKLPVDAEEQPVERFTVRTLIMTQQYLVSFTARTWNIAAAFTGRVWHRNLELATPSGCCTGDWSGAIYRTYGCCLT